MILRLALILSCLSPLSAAAAVRALLIGVSDYHTLDADLRGPRNDVRLMAQALIGRGADPASLKVLTTPGADLPAAVAPAADPTRAAILAGLDDLAATSEPGDTVVVYYSGHGSQAPDQNGDEAGGYDEIILPSDSTNWKGAIGAVENSIVDDELRLKMQAILDTGAHLVAILDACHSATGFRGAAAGVARYVAPKELGIPEGAVPAEGGHVAPPPRGDFVFLYSSQADERSFEYALGDPADPANWYGDFTRNLAAVLTAVPRMTWAQALAASADGLRREQGNQTPDGEGPGLAEPVFGGVADANGRLRVEGGVLTGGLLDGLSDGAEVQLFATAAGGAPLGRAVLADVGAARAVLVGAPDLPAVAYAQLLAPGRPAPLHLAPPVVADAGNYARALQRVAQVRASEAVDGVLWDDAAPDAGLVLAHGSIILVGRDGVLDPLGPGSSPRIAADSEADAIAAFLDRAVRGARLHRALAAAEGVKRGLSLKGAGLAVTAELRPAAAAGGGCADPQGAARVLNDLDPVADCDQVWLTLGNGSTTAQDVTVLYVDRDLRVTPIWPDAGLSNRVAFGEAPEVGLQIRDPDALARGVEEIIVIAVPARAGAPRTVLTALADPAAGRATDMPTLTAWLMAAADPDQTRWAGAGGKIDPINVTRLRVTLAERETIANP